MKDKKTVNKFIEMKAENETYKVIAKELGISEKTIADWTKKYKLEIDNRKAIQNRELMKKYELDVKEEVKKLAKIRNKATEELLKRDYKKLSTRELLNVITSTDAMLGNRRKYLNTTYKIRKTVKGMPDLTSDLFSDTREVVEEVDL